MAPPTQNSPNVVSLDSLSLGRGVSGAHADAGLLDDATIQATLDAFEAEQRAALGLDEEPEPVVHYTEYVNRDFFKSQRATTTVLVGGLTVAHDYLVEGALRGVGYGMEMMDVPDYEALRFGKEFGNRGQCNPTYFTVGNLVKFLVKLRDERGMSSEEIIEKYVFLTAGACGPCRFGTYVTEYRKALRDAGFDGFRVLLFQQQGGLKQATGEEVGLELNRVFFTAIVKALLTGDVINLLGYRIRPYEVVPGAADQAVEDAKAAMHHALWHGESLLMAMLKVRRIFGAVEVDRTRPKPKVAIIGEFWAMTTEGDGNYKMQKFLQDEGAEVDVQIVTAWILFILWENIRDRELRMQLRHDDAGKKGLRGKDAFKAVGMLKAADVLVRVIFQGLSNVMGLHGYHLPNMFEVADVASDFYNHELRGGEAHMEVGKLILNVVKSKVNMTLSVKPFGCMPSSGVSDGVQSTITELYPDAIFLPIETSGDGAVNVYSRVQMMLFKARKQAEAELDGVLERYGMSHDDFQATVSKHGWWLNHALFKAPHHHGSSAADLAELAGALRHPLKGLKFALSRRRAPKRAFMTVDARQQAKRAAKARAAQAA